MTCCTCSHSEISRILLLCSSSRNKGKTLTVLKKADLSIYNKKLQGKTNSHCSRFIPFWENIDVLEKLVGNPSACSQVPLHLLAFVVVI